MTESYEDRIARLEKNRMDAMIKQSMIQGTRISASDVKSYEKVLGKQKFSWRALVKKSKPLVKKEVL